MRKGGGKGGHRPFRRFGPFATFSAYRLFGVFLARHQIYDFVVGVSMVVEAMLLIDLRQGMAQIGSAAFASL